MNLVDLYALSPLLILLTTALILLLVESFTEEFAKKSSAWIALLGIAIALFAAYNAPVSGNPLLTPWLKFDPLARLFNLFFLSIGLGTTLLGSAFFQRFKGTTQGEYYFLLLAALFGLMMIGSSADFLTLFLGIETLSLALYVMCGYMKTWERSHESALKYFLMGALAAAFLLYGIALIYGATGTTRLPMTAQANPLFLSGLALVTLALCFEAAVVPFHQWAPDVYDGAPTPVTAFMAVGTKVGAFAAFARVFLDPMFKVNPLWNEGVALLAIATLIYANFVALCQTNMRRFFAYSGIAQAGFLLIPLIAGTPQSLNALLFYLIIYAFATLGCFAVLALLDDRSEGVEMNDVKGLFKKAPFLAAFFSLCLLTLAGIPPTAGFFAKFYLFKVAFEAKYYLLVIVALLTTLLSAYYYLRIVALMLSGTSEEMPNRWVPALAVSVVTLAGILWFSVNPEPLLMLIK